MEEEHALLRYSDETELITRIVALCWRLCDLRRTVRAAAEVSDVHRGVSRGVGWSKHGDAHRYAFAHNRGAAVCSFHALSDRAVDSEAHEALRLNP